MTNGYGRETLAVASVLAGNLAVHTVVPDALHIPVNLGTASFVSALALCGGAGLDDLGLDPAQLMRGVRAGLGAGALIAGGVALAARSERARPFFADQRVADHTPRRAAYELALRIPLATALAEELLFRGALPALLATRHRETTATVVSAALFGAWHIVPTLASLETAAAGTLVADRRAQRAGAVAAVGGVTALAGIAFAALRRRSGSVVAPVLAHAALNASSFVVARLVAGTAAP